MSKVFPDIKLSIIIAVLDSHRIVKRYLRLFKRMELPDDIEIIIMDDGSKPPLDFPEHGVHNLNIYPTGDYRPWTQACARNLGARIALGEYLLMTDIDHILTKEAIMAVREFDGDRMVFPRHFGVLSIKGRIVNDPDTLFSYGLPERYRGKTTFSAGHHTNTFAMKKSLYVKFDGYNPKYCGIAEGANHGDKNFYRKYVRCVERGECAGAVAGPKIYVYPGMAKCKTLDEIDPRRLFHDLVRG